jgi:predicted transposase YbfD/YdcC
MNKSDEISFLDVFSKIKDPRSSRNRLYTMSEILLAALCAGICGAEGWQDVQDFGEAKLEYLRTILPYKNGIPSDDTFRRFFRALDPEQFKELFIEWAREIRPNIADNVVAIDGKTSRHSFDDETEMLHMVSAFATEHRLVLGQEKVCTKSNEITAIPKLLQCLDIKGATVTIDAMGCQHAIAKQIINKQGDYIFSLKGNQGKLLDDVQTYFEDLTLYKAITPFRQSDKGHGRLESRTCWVIKDIQWLRDRHPEWHSIKSIIKINSTRTIKNKTTEETRYYISSCTDNPEKALEKIRSHWAIENSLHWILDVVFGDDQSRIRKQNAPHVMSILRHIALNLLQLQKASMPRQSIKRLRKMAGWDDNILSSILLKFS